jgi:Mce-associated membrane protein
MSSDTIDEVTLTEDTETSAEDVADEADAAGDADDAVADVDDAADKPRRNRLPKVQLRPARPSRWVAVIVAAAVIAVGVFGFLKYRSTADQLAALRQTEADRDTVAKLAKEYALKSLTYSFEDPDAFFRSVEGGVSQALKDKYVNATDILKAVMLQAQVTSSGEVLATDPVAQPGQVYQVVVSAAQTTRNLQNPKPRLSLILLQITVNKVGDNWQVSDIGPKTGSHLPSADPLAPPGPGAAPVPAPAPAPPPPPRR